MNNFSLINVVIVLSVIIIVVIAYMPTFYKINKRLNYLENEMKKLNGE